MNKNKTKPHEHNTTVKQTEYSDYRAIDTPSTSPSERHFVRHPRIYKSVAQRIAKDSLVHIHPITKPVCFPLGRQQISNPL